MAGKSTLQVLHIPPAELAVMIALFAAAIYNIYSIYSAKERFNGLYDSERSSGKMGNHSTPSTGALRTG